ncbi:unnamed protein product [Pylaiella littoralis]
MKVARRRKRNTVPFFQAGMVRVKQASKADMQSARCFYLHGANNLSTPTAVVRRADTGRLCFTTNVVWINRGAPAAPAAVLGIGGRSSVPATDAPPGESKCHVRPRCNETNRSARDRDTVCPRVSAKVHRCYLHGANNHSTSTAVVLRADTG